MSYTQTPYVPYGTATSFGQEEARLAKERANTFNGLKKYGMTESGDINADGRMVASVSGDKYVYNTKTGEWHKMGGRKLQKTRYAKKCAKSSKKCRYSHYKNTAKRSRRRRTNQK